MNLFPAVNYETLCKLKIPKLIPLIKQKQDWSTPLKLRLVESLTNIPQYQIQEIYNDVYNCFHKLDDYYPNIEIEYLKNELVPYFMYQGNLDLLKTKCITIGGTRTPSHWGIVECKRVSSYLGSKNFTLVSGLAKGIDTITHKKALELGIKTIAVIATPINKFYPAENRKLQNQISKEGLLISPFAPNTITKKWHFLLRNKIMVNISLASIVIEAFDKGGSTKMAEYSNFINKPIFTSNFFYKNNITTWQKMMKDIYIYKNYEEITKTIENSNFGKTIKKKLQKEFFL